MCPVIWTVGVIAVAYLWWWLPLRKPLELVRVARWLETHHPELDERVSTVLEVSSHGDSGMSAQLIGQLAKEAAASLDDINPKVEVSTRRARHWLWPATALLAESGAALFALWPDPTARHVVRALVPTSNLGNAAGRITVTPGSIELIEGDSLQITARHSAGPATRLELILHLTDGTSTTAADGTRATMARSIRSAGPTGHFEYEVRSGRETSDRFKVTVWPEPRLTDPRVKLEFPAYTGWAPREQALGDGVSCDQRHQGRIAIQTQHAGRIRASGDRRGSRRSDTSSNARPMAAPVPRDGRLKRPATAWAAWCSNTGSAANSKPRDFPIESLADTPPEVKWLSAMQKETRLRRDDLLEMGYEVTDDVGLGFRETGSPATTR